MNFQPLQKFHPEEIIPLFSSISGPILSYPYPQLTHFLKLPAEKSWIDEVSCFPVNLRSLSFPSWGSYAVMWRICCFDNLSMAFSISLQTKSKCKSKSGIIHSKLKFTLSYKIPLGALIASVEKLQWAPAPFQSPCIGFGSNVTTMPNSSATRCNRNRAIQSWSPMSMPSQGPTWNSHYNIEHSQHIGCINIARKHWKLPELAWPRRWYQQCWFQHTDTLYSGPLLFL